MGKFSAKELEVANKKFSAVTNDLYGRLDGVLSYMDDISGLTISSNSDLMDSWSELYKTYEKYKTDSKAVLEEVSSSVDKAAYEQQQYEQQQARQVSKMLSGVEEVNNKLGR